jgi:murein DD-endopeptidase MepM/ murein hydrolase activator NlpD
VTSRYPLRALIAGLALSSLGLALAGPAVADPHTDKARVDRQMAQVHSLYEAASAQAQAALEAYNAATAQLPAIQERLAVARGVVVARQAEARQADREGAAARDTLAGAHQRYADAAGQVDAARTQIGDFVAASYKGAGLLSIDSLLESRTPTDLLDRLAYVEKSAQQQERALDAFLTARLAAKDADNQATLAQRAADAAARRAQDALGSALAAQAAAEQDQAALTAVVAQQQQAMATANAQRDATVAQYAALQRESDRIAAQLRNQSGGVANLHGSGHFLTPVNGWKSSDFGMRYDPYYRVWQLHAGVDLAAPGGTPIYAAGDGQVVQAGWSGGYGNYTCIYHGMYQGRGLSTCYGHQSAILVHVGQRVGRGDLIGRVGTTGASTGDHLHFEVRVNGSPVQPLDWLDPGLR